MDEYTFRHCSKGHYYQGEECPYCKTHMTPFEDKNNYSYQERHYMNGCPNGHAYNKQLFCCPYCGEKRVVDERVDMITAWIGNLSIGLKQETSIKVNGKLINETSRLDISWAQHTHRSSYAISGIPDFDYKSKIEIGYIEFTGKQMIRLIDYLIDNVKDYKISE